MALKDRMKAAWGALRGDGPVESPVLPRGFSVKTHQIPANSPEGQAIMRAMASGDQHAIVAALKAAGAGPEPEPTPIQQAARGALGGDHIGDQVEWEVWQHEAEILTREAPGWSPCRFYYRSSPTHAQGAFGVVKGNFGIWRQLFDVCGFDDEDEVVLPSLTYLPAGLNLCPMETTPLAVEAAGILEALDWQGMPQANLTDECRAAWVAQQRLVTQTLAFHGIVCDQRRHAHNITGELINIMARAEKGVEEGKPSKRELS